MFYIPIERPIRVVDLVSALVWAATTAIFILIVLRAPRKRSPRSLESGLSEPDVSASATSARTRQLRCLVELGQWAMEEEGSKSLLEEAASQSAKGLGISLCGIFQALPGRPELQLRAGVGSARGLVGDALVPAGVGSLVGFVAQEAGTVLSEDLKVDDRFPIALLENEHNVAGGMGVRIRGSNGPHGVLVAYTTKPQTLFVVAHAERGAFCDDEVWFLRSVAAILGSNLSRIEAQRALEAQASTDSLTGLHNARYLREEASAVEGRAARSGGPISAVMFDVDHFKDFNDTFGHPAGDDVLRELGTILRGEARAGDLVSRCGGEEFAIVLPETEAAEAREFAERLRRVIASYYWPLRPITASFGIATGGSANHLNVAALLSAADRALYVSKVDRARPGYAHGRPRCNGGPGRSASPDWGTFGEDDAASH